MSHLLKNEAQYLLLLLCMAGCKEPFNPPPTVTKNHFLVVEGRINDGSPTTILLSRTRNLTDTNASKTVNFNNDITTPVFELNAKVDVEDDHGDTYSLPELGNGQYGGITLPLNDQYLYRLHIETDNGEEYLSTYVPVLHTPSIDSINWELNNEGVSIYLNTHNNQDAVGYYRWEYDETWEYKAYYYSSYKYDTSSNTLVLLTTDPTYYCWQSDTSTGILAGNTAGLKSDTVSSQYITSIPYHSEKMDILYSILVKQYAISQSAYNFWNGLKSNTEELGSLFDPQPSNATGNIQCVTNPNEPVIGYVGAGDMTEKRIFIYNTALPDWNKDVDSCGVIAGATDSTQMHYLYYVEGFDPISPIEWAPAPCVDCRLHGGTNVKPSFWP